MKATYLIWILLLFFSVNFGDEFKNIYKYIIKYLIVNVKLFRNEMFMLKPGLNLLFLRQWNNNLWIFLVWAIRCYVGHGNDYKEKKCALDDHSCVKELEDGSITFSVKSIFHENDFTEKWLLFFPNFWNR